MTCLDDLKREIKLESIDMILEMDEFIEETKRILQFGEK